jgi:myo-inositol-1(or 4)-monophosphatase
MKPTLPDLERLAREAGAILREGYNKEHQISYKGVIDLVTEIDHASETFLLKEIHAHFPDSHIIAEESGEIKGSNGGIWYIDPLDGTVNYSHHIPLFCVSIAYAFDDIVILGAVYDPLRDEMFTAERGKGAFLNGKQIHASQTTELQKSLLVTGFPYDTWDTKQDNFRNFEKLAKLTQGVRRIGSAALDGCYVGAGRFDAFWEFTLKPWDIAAAGLIAEEAGARVTAIDGKADYISAPQSVLVAAPGIYQKMMEQLT